jgi:hypothetical protein
MHEGPIRDPRLLELLEACRLGNAESSDPLEERLLAELAASPELDDLYERLRRLDASLTVAFSDVPVPKGLQERILARLDAARIHESGGAIPAEGTARPSVVSRPRPWQSRLLWGVVAVSAVVLFAFVWLGRTPRDLGGSIDWNLAFEKFQGDLEGGLHGLGQPVETAPASHPVSSAVVVYPGTTWRTVRDFLGCQGVAYDLTDPSGVRATLYVIRATAALPDAPDYYQPTVTTGNRSLVMWQEGGLVYALAVEAGDRGYQQFLAVSVGPVA